MGALTYLPTQSSSFDPYLPIASISSSSLHDSHPQALNTMTGNKSNEEGPPLPPPPPPRQPQSPPMTNRHHEEIMTAIRNLSNGPSQPATHPLASIAGIDIYLRDMAEAQQQPNTTQRFGVNVVPPLPRNEMGSAGDVPYWSGWFRSLAFERRAATLDCMRKGLEVAENELVVTEAAAARERSGQDEAAKRKADRDAGGGGNQGQIMPGDTGGGGETGESCKGQIGP